MRRPGARTAPVARTRTRSQVGLVKKATNGASQCIRIGGTGSISSCSEWTTVIERDMARPDPMLERLEAFNRSRGGGLVVRRAANGYSLYSERSGGPVARLKPTGEDDKVRVLA